MIVLVSQLISLVKMFVRAYQQVMSTDIAHFYCALFPVMDTKDLFLGHFRPGRTAQRHSKQTEHKGHLPYFLTDQRKPPESQAK